MSQCLDGSLLQQSKRVEPRLELAAVDDLSDARKHDMVTDGARSCLLRFLAGQMPPRLKPATASFACETGTNRDASFLSLFPECFTAVLEAPEKPISRPLLMREFRRIFVDEQINKFTTKRGSSGDSTTGLPIYQPSLFLSPNGERAA